jgi:hypothetical protein
MFEVGHFSFSELALSLLPFWRSSTLSITCGLSSTHSHDPEVLPASVAAAGNFPLCRPSTCETCKLSTFKLITKHSSGALRPLRPWIAMCHSCPHGWELLYFVWPGHGKSSIAFHSSTAAHSSPCQDTLSCFPSNQKTNGRTHIYSWN